MFEEVETGLAAIDARLAAKADSNPRKAPREKPRFPSHLVRVEEILEPEVLEELQGKERVEIGRELELFELTEEIFDQMPPFIYFQIDFARLAAARVGRRA
ncbi:hypothetical protein [Methylocystis sp. JR02]|uniref:hypothetical protein n=1 Tax=Methylocystis sp. JR02 TaxID=3046284 RepID=UPI0024BAF552|nr:hypothetical protein [Methylocystis sp. JR02]MDJ0447124.1 hypothetical protein [Methylocystis sp. JR02]